MKFVAKKMTFACDSFFQLLGTIIDMKLIVSKKRGKIIGDGYPYDVAEAITTLVLDWEAKILLSEKPSLPKGEYALVSIGEKIFAVKDQEKFELEDCSCVVKVKSVPEIGD